MTRLGTVLLVVGLFAACSGEIEVPSSVDAALRRHRDAGTPPPADAGTPPPADAGTPPPPDAGTSAPADAGTSAPGDAGAPSGQSCALTPTSTLVVSARDTGAVGDGVTDDTAALQRAIDQVAGTGGTAYVPAGTYLVNVNAQLPNTGRQHALHIGSTMTLRMDPNAIIKAMPSNFETYAVLGVYMQSDVSIVGGQLEGDLLSHTGTTGEWGFGIDIRSSSHVRVDGVTSRLMWGDGFFVNVLSGSSAPMQDVELCNVLADRNRRQGFSIVGGTGIHVHDSTFQNTAGTYPEAGIDVETDIGTSVRDVVIERNLFTGNAGDGVRNTSQPTAPLTDVTGVLIRDNVMRDNGREGVVIDHSTSVTVDHNVLTGNNNGVDVSTGSQTSVIQNNTVTSNRAWGVLIEAGCVNNQVLNNDLRNAGALGALQDQGTGTVISGNQL